MITTDDYCGLYIDGCDCFLFPVGKCTLPAIRNSILDTYAMIIMAQLGILEDSLDISLAKIRHQ